MKLNPRKNYWIIRQKQNGVPAREIASDRRYRRDMVQQLQKIYVDLDGRRKSTIGASAKNFREYAVKIVKKI
jgi:hypothetical protein